MGLWVMVNVCRLSYPKNLNTKTQMWSSVFARLFNVKKKTIKLQISTRGGDKNMLIYY